MMIIKRTCAFCSNEIEILVQDNINPNMVLSVRCSKHRVKRRDNMKCKRCSYYLTNPEICEDCKYG